MMHSRTRTLARTLVIPSAVLLLTACEPGDDAPPGATLSIGELLGGADTLHERAIHAREFAFPRDHGPHPGFRTEWWYFTGSLTADDGREIGYQLTFFRSALTDSASYASATAVSADAAAGADTDTVTIANEDAETMADADTATEQLSAWRGRHAYMAHFAVTDAGTGRFRATEKFARGAAGLAGVELGTGAVAGPGMPAGPGAESGPGKDPQGPLRIWLEDWSAVSTSSTSTFPLRLRAEAGDIAIDLTLDRGKPIVLQGDRGLSRKGAEPGNASYYYSLTRMPTRGTVRTSAGTWSVRGSSWLDREWSTSVLSPGVTGWDWLSLQLNDSTELMMYRLRREDGAIDPFSAAMFIDADGGTRGFAADEFRMSPVATWEAADGVTYPVAWRVEIPTLDLALDISTPVEDQELVLAVRYWEGMIRARGTRAGGAVDGRGYLEMTGYSGAAPDRTR